MNIVEAIRSGKRFRRKGEIGWYAYTHGVVCEAKFNTYSRWSLWPPAAITADILADDWEVEATYYPVTEEELADLLKYSAGAVSRDYVIELDDRIKARGPVTK